MVEPVTEISNPKPLPAQRKNSWIRPLVFAAIGFAAFRWLGHSSSGPSENSVAQDFSLAIAGEPAKSVNLEGYRGKPLVIEVFAHWCGACKSMAPRMAELAKARRQSPAQFLGVAVDGTAQQALSLHASWGIPFDIALGDQRFSADYRITSLPTIIVIDAEGKVRHVTTGVTLGSTVDKWLTELGAAPL